MNDKEVIYSKQSNLNLIEVIKSKIPNFEGLLELRLNKEPYSYSFYPDENFARKDIINICCIIPLMGRIQKVLLLSLGPGAMFTKMSYFYKDLIFDAVEIDPEIVEVGYRYFGLQKSVNINVFIIDAREFLESTNSLYDLIIVDVFKEGRTPPHLSTYEFFKLVKNHLNKKGVFLLNVSCDHSYNKNIRPIAKTVGKVFPSVFFVPWPLLLAFKERTFLWALKRRLKKSNPHPALDELTKWVILQTKKFRWRMTDKIFFDRDLKNIF